MRRFEALGLAILLAACAYAQDGTLAFPGAEGFGRFSLGGRGGQVMKVTTLDDYVPGEEPPIEGSLRAACQAKGPRIVVFEVAGIITLKTGLNITEPYLTIAGQSAPGDGVCLKDYACVFQNTHDVVVRYLRSRPGDAAGVSLDAFTTGRGCRNIILDHCSASWGNDETLSVSGADQDNLTVQWCMITESLNESHHVKGRHGFGTLLRTNGRVTFHHNLYAHHMTRCPRPGTYGEGSGLLLDFRNNVIYNWIIYPGYSAADAVRMNYVGNYLRPGPSSEDLGYAFNVGGETTHIYAEDVVMDGVEVASVWELFRNAGPENREGQAFPVAPVETDGAREALERVLEGAGATLPKRDAVDARVVREVRERTGRVIDSQAEVGGWPEYKGGDVPADHDSDGMPDQWERSNALDPENPVDNAHDDDNDGYTNIEEYLNGTDPHTGD